MEAVRETYSQMSNRHRKEVNEFPIRAAFSNKQFEEMMQEWGLKVTDTKAILSLGAGCYIRKSDKQAFTEMMNRHRRERKAAIEEDHFGDGFIFQMFRDELNDHEYNYTGDVSDTLKALDLTLEEIESNPALLAGFNKAKKYCA